ncbi:hypothetical protein [Nocardia camponoti]|uniref:Uncharacterized protein n=1 Tax=Nocardia camponoti TaxID=1616106 RepID=A0A917QA17_9NOCA|nr:hypothetical protein [Nocardia camponoti]GGK39178.1 hypothetical protein GCM10011591_08570 [Nocardia camponoti]
MTSPNHENPAQPNYAAMPPYPAQPYPGQPLYPGQQPDPSAHFAPGQQPYPQPVPVDQFGQPLYAGQHPYAAYYGPAVPTSMPGTVRAAQVISLIAGALGIVLIIAIGAVGGGEAAGRAVAGFIPFVVLAGLACAYGSGGPATRGWAIGIGALECLCGLGGAASQQAPGLMGLIVGATVLLLLSQRSAATWFRRPR